MDKLGGFRDKYNGAQDFDIIMRACEESIIIIIKIVVNFLQLGEENYEIYV